MIRRAASAAAADIEHTLLALRRYADFRRRYATLFVSLR